MMPFHFDIVDNSGNILVTIKRDWTFWLSKIAILYNEQEVAHINQKFAMTKPKFMIFENNGSQIGEIIGNWHAWNFKISDGAGKQIGKIDKKWNGVFKEGFTTADKYRVKIEKDVVENTQKIIITAAAIVVDMVLKEAK